MRYPALAETLKRDRRAGPRCLLCTAAIAETSSGISQRGSLLTAEDFARTEATLGRADRHRFAGVEILEIPPNGQGITALIALNILSHFDLGRYEPESVERRHLQIEAMKLAWVLRNRHIADPDFAGRAGRGAAERQYRRRLAASSTSKRAMRRSATTRSREPGSDTVYLTVVDSDRLAVSFINSIYQTFGSGIVSPRPASRCRTAAPCFVTDPGHPNCIGPGKRPLHTIIPAMVPQGWPDRHVVRRDGRRLPADGPRGASSSTAMSTAWTRRRRSISPAPSRWTAPSRSRPACPRRPPRARRQGPSRGARRTAAGRRPDVEIDRNQGALVGGSDPRKDGWRSAIDAG